MSKSYKELVSVAALDMFEDALDKYMKILTFRRKRSLGDLKTAILVGEIPTVFKPFTQTPVKGQNHTQTPPEEEPESSNDGEEREGRGLLSSKAPLFSIVLL